MEVSEACQICFKKEIKVYPVKVGGTFRIEVKEGQNKPVRYNKPVKAGIDTGKAMASTYIFLAKKILKKETYLI